MANERPAIPLAIRRAVLFEARHHCALCCNPLPLEQAHVIPWNPTRLIQRVGRVNRVNTKFDHIFTCDFFPTDEGNDLIKLREAAEAKIHAFIQMLGADARLLTAGEEIVSHDLFAQWNSKKTITGEDEDEDTELKFLTEIRALRDKKPDLFERIKRLEREIDELVYGLYGLTPEEIQIMEGAAK